ncbi:MAG: hypothetical protein KJ726_08655 [Verrucomicrobia bacterium]|nr:hypothetical protein [Verrucomicrobiota bacterium]MBU1910104.1 hypothetical protein [Verrucomicrobiota bacterium]
MRVLPEVLAALALGWLLRLAPYVIQGYYGQWRTGLARIGELRDRVPLSRAGELKGTYPAIQWINENVPRDQNLLYIGTMRVGIRLRYYTLPRTARWYFIYSPREVARLDQVVAQEHPDWVVVEQFSALRTIPGPASWQPVWSDRQSRLQAFKVDHDLE